MQLHDSQSMWRPDVRAILQHLNGARLSKDFYQDVTCKYSTKNLGLHIETQNFFYIFIIH